jgi:predicted RNase H-like HicB family nuclease
MKRNITKGSRQFPVVITKDEDGFYVAECGLFEGCYTQGKTLDEALKNIKEVISLCLEEGGSKRRHLTLEASIHTVSV